MRDKGQRIRRRPNVVFVMGPEIGHKEPFRRINSSERWVWTVCTFRGKFSWQFRYVEREREKVRNGYGLETDFIVRSKCCPLMFLLGYVCIRKFLKANGGTSWDFGNGIRFKVPPRNNAMIGQPFNKIFVLSTLFENIG